MKGWKRLPLSYKILFIILILWAAMSVMATLTMPDRNIAFFGFLLSGTYAYIVIGLLDVIAPFIFLYAMWNKLKWGAAFGMSYNGIFILNNLMALFTFREIFGNGIYFPLIAGILFFYTIYRERQYFL